MPLKLMKKRSGFPVAAGILTIIGACLIVIVGLAGLLSFWLAMSQGVFGFGYSPSILYYLVMGIINSLAFAFGLAGGICAIRRRRFALAIAGTTLLLVSGLVTIAVFALQGYYAIVLGAMFGLPVLIISILALIFVAVSKGEFD
jgi:hypothetical protein